jgi:hypothetical protein
MIMMPRGDASDSLLATTSESGISSIRFLVCWCVQVEAALDEGELDMMDGG